MFSPEPSSAMISSQSVSVWANTDPIVGGRNCSRLNVGIRTETAGTFPRLPMVEEVTDDMCSLMDSSRTPQAASDAPPVTRHTGCLRQRRPRITTGSAATTRSSRTCAARCGAGSIATFTPASRLIDLGCGTGLDAVRMARHGHDVTATDWSAAMVERTAQRARAEEALGDRVHAVHVGAHELSGG